MNVVYGVVKMELVNRTGNFGDVHEDKMKALSDGDKHVAKLDPKFWEIQQAFLIKLLAFVVVSLSFLFPIPLVIRWWDGWICED